MNESVIIYVGNFKYPNHNAAGKRVLGNLEALKEAGYKTVCLCYSDNQTSEKVEYKDFDGTDRYTIAYTLGFARLNNKLPKEAFKFVLSKYPLEKIKAVVMYNSIGTSDFNSFVIKYCRKRNIKVYYDIVDYFDTPQKSNYLRYLMKKRELNRIFNKVLPSCDGWITISSFLKERMADPSKAIIIPPLALTKGEKQRREPSDTVVFSYATFMRSKHRPLSQWKDRGDAYIDVFYKLLSINTKKDFKINFLGFTKQQMIDVFPEDVIGEYIDKINALDEYITYHGPMNNEDVQKVIKNSDFTILLRDSKTCNNAGFPTKVSESLSLGVPVVVNDTSDILSFVKDGVNGVVAPMPDDTDAVADKIAEILDMDDEQLQSLRDGACDTDGFYYKNYTEIFKDYFG